MEPQRRPVAGLVMRVDPGFWAGRRVLLTGHTGFKGAWAARMLAAMGAEVTGFALDPAQGPSAFEALGVAAGLARDLRGDLRDRAAVVQAVEGVEITLHFAAQAIVSQGFRDPADTWSSNLTGTLNLLDALRGRGHGRGQAAALIVTSDKVYAQPGPGRPFVETDPLGGDDPYSASKGACEILVASHRASFADLPPLVTARAGNVIGGGDFGADRLIPDLVRATLAGEALMLRNPESTRPFQHVLDVVSGYLMLAEAAARGTAPSALNFGPAEAELSVRDLLAAWEAATGSPVPWRLVEGPKIPEKPRLALDSGLAQTRLGWRPRLRTAEAVAEAAAWYADWARGADMAAASDARIARWMEESDA